MGQTTKNENWLNLNKGINYNMKTISTLTAEGYIPHYCYFNYMFPVKLDFNKQVEYFNGDKYYYPLKIDNRLVYALPGGKSFIS